MQNSLEQSSEQESEIFWAIYWHRIWQVQASPIAVAHIAAYLQEVCYWVARKMKMNVAGQHSVGDFFQTAIARVDKVIKGFNPQLGSNLKIYAEYTFSNLIKDLLRKRQEVDICTDWGLLHKLSQKRLVESLKQAGYPSQIIERYVLAWSCFLHELRNTNPDAMIPAGFKLRLLTEDLQPFVNNEDTATEAIPQLYIDVELEPGEGLVWEVEPTPDEYDREILRF
ncbi:MAG: DUF1822 family protein [Nostoc sp.]